MRSKLNKECNGSHSNIMKISADPFIYNLPTYFLWQLDLDTKKTNSFSILLANINIRFPGHNSVLEYSSLNGIDFLRGSNFIFS